MAVADFPQLWCYLQNYTVVFQKTEFVVIHCHEDFIEKLRINNNCKKIKIPKNDCSNT